MHWDIRVYIACLAFRLINSLLIRTTFAPDEYWQSVEVAHRMVFGYGHLTWEWAAGLRGYLHPTIFAALYWVLKSMGWDSTWATARGPMMLQAIFAAAADISVYAIASLLFGRKCARWALACQLLSWFNFYCSVRTYSNCLEALLTSAAAYHWLAVGAEGGSGRGPGWQPGEQQRHDGSSNGGYEKPRMQLGNLVGHSSSALAARGSIRQRGTSTAEGSPAVGRQELSQPQQQELQLVHERSEGRTGQQAAALANRWHQRCWILLGALAAVLRPPCALFWAVLGLHSLAGAGWSRRALSLLLDAVGIVGACLAATTLWDSIHYGRPVFVAWEFLRFNLLGGGSALYGSHPMHWNLTQGFPAVAATLLPLMALGLVLSNLQQRRLAWLAAVSLALYSLPAHKEFRFLLPALTLTMPYCGPALCWLLEKPGGVEAAGVVKGGGSVRAAGSGGAGTGPAAAGAVQGRDGKAAVRSACWRGRRAVATVTAALAGVQVLMALYFSMVQHRGLMLVPSELAQLWDQSPQNTTVLFLTQCHATPWYSHVHRPIPMRFLDCSPPGWAPAVQQLNAREFGWLRLPTPPPCAPPSHTEAAPSSGRICTSQQQLFRKDAAAFLEQVFTANAAAPPRVLVAYDGQLSAGAEQVLAQNGCRQHRRISNCWWQTDEDTHCSIVLWLCDDRSAP